MKLKNISVAEKHVEKIILLIAAVFLLYVVWAYFITSRFSVELNGLQTPPSQIDDTISRQAHTLDNKLNGKAPDVLVNWKSPDYVGLFNNNLATPTTPPGPDGSTNHLTVAIFTGGQLNSDTKVHSPENPDNPIVDGTNPPFEIPTIPTPTSLVVRSDLGTLDTTANSMEILKSFGSQPPLDIQWVTVAARFDMAKLAEQLNRPPTADKQRIKPDLWRDKAALLDVHVERRMLNADGSWSEPVLVPPMTGRFTARNAINSVNVSTAPTTIEAAKVNQLQIVQPTFYALRNTTWLPPQVPADSSTTSGTTPAAESTNLTELRRRLDDANANLARRMQELQQASSNPARQRQIQNIITQLQRNIATLTQQIQAAGGTAPTAPATIPGAFPGAFPGAPNFNPDFPGAFEQPGMFPGQQPESSPITGSLMTQNTFECWANDFSVQPGKTYQYRMRIAFSNPLYRQPGIPDSQKDLFNQFTLTSQWTDWSAPITSIQDSYFFVVAGNVANHSARVEIWKFYDGLWRKYEESISPGDPIGKPTNQYSALITQPPTNTGAAPIITGPQQTINFSTGAVLVDTDFAYKVVLPSLNIPQTTLRALFVTDGQLVSCTELGDKERRDTLLKQIAPDATADAGPGASDLERMRAYKERLDREKADRAGRAPTRTTPDRGPRMPGTGPGGDMPFDMN